MRKFLISACLALTATAATASSVQAATITEIVAASGGTFDSDNNDYDILLNAVLAADLVQLGQREGQVGQRAVGALVLEREQLALGERLARVGHEVALRAVVRGGVLVLVDLVGLGRSGADKGVEPVRNPNEKVGFVLR